MSFMTGIDWGTSSLRAYLIDAQGRLLGEQEHPLGIMRVGEGQFARTLEEIIAPWRQSHAPSAIVMSGMVGSRQGWIEAPYISCPVASEDLAAQLVAVELLSGTRAWIVPGVKYTTPDDRPDVMRGEETQVFGAAALCGVKEGLFVLPGTHSKWARLAEGRITGFETYLTGETFAVLREHSILGRLMQGEQGSGAGFEAGLAAANALATPGDLLNAFFSVRALGLFDKLPPSEAGDYLSGLLIGAELKAATRRHHGALRILADPALASRYAKAAECLGLACHSAPAASTAAGLHLIARTAGLVS